MSEVTLLLSYRIKQNSSWKTNWFSASKENPRILWNPNVYYRIHKLHATRPYTGEYRSNPYYHIPLP